MHCGVSDGDMCIRPVPSGESWGKLACMCDGEGEHACQLGEGEDGEVIGGVLHSFADGGVVGPVVGMVIYHAAPCEHDTNR